jgi:hypothetical protein
MTATYVALTCGSYVDVLQLLFEQNLFDWAALFYASLRQVGFY